MIWYRITCYTWSIDLIYEVFYQLLTADWFWWKILAVPVYITKCRWSLAINKVILIHDNLLVETTYGIWEKPKVCQVQLWVCPLKCTFLIKTDEISTDYTQSASQCLSRFKVGDIGLSSTDSWTSTTHAIPLRNHGACLGSILWQRWQCRLPITSAAAAEKWGLPSEKIYRIASNGATDPEVDLVVVSVEVPMHRELTLPALKAGKVVFFEWPACERCKGGLGANRSK